MDEKRTRGREWEGRGEFRGVGDWEQKDWGGRGEREDLGACEGRERRIWARGGERCEPSPRAPSRARASQPQSFAGDGNCHPGGISDENFA